MFNLEGKIVFITGASSGIGEACAREFAKLNANLVLAARRKDRLIKLADELEKEYRIKVKYLNLMLEILMMCKTNSTIWKLTGNKLMYWLTMQD